MLLLRNKDQDRNNPLASFATCLCGQKSDMSELHICTVTLSVSGASRSRLCPDGPRVHLSSVAYMPSCKRPEVRLPLDQRVFCGDFCKKCRLLCLAQVVFSYFVLHSSKIPLVLMTNVAHLRSLLFRHPDGANCIVRRVYFGVVPKQINAVSGLWKLTLFVQVGLSPYLLTFVGDLRYKMLLI